MKSLLDVVKEQCCHLLSSEQRPFLLAANGGAELTSFVTEERKSLSGRVVAKSSRELAKQARHMNLLLVVEAAEHDVTWEDDVRAQVMHARLVAILDGHQLIRRYGQNLDLADASLRGAQLQGADLRAANLENCDLQGADLERANLKGARLTGANLQGCNLTEANLFGADLLKADLRRANLRHTELRQTKWAGAALRGAEFWAANIWGVDLQDAFRDGVDLTRADARGS